MGRSKAAKARDATKTVTPAARPMEHGVASKAEEANRRADAINPRRTQPGWKKEGPLNDMLAQSGMSASNRRVRLSNLASHLEGTWFDAAPVRRQLTHLNDEQFGHPHTVDVDFSHKHYMEKGPVMTHRITVLAHTGQDALHQAHDMVKAKGHYVHGTRHVERDSI